MNGMDSFAQMAGAAGGLMFLLALLVLALMGLLIPFFVWRIWTWTYRTCQELQQLNARIDQLSQRLAASESAAEKMAPAGLVKPAKKDFKESPRDLSAEAVAAAAAMAVPTAAEPSEGEAQAGEAESAAPDFDFAPLEDIPAEEPPAPSLAEVVAAAEEQEPPWGETFGFPGDADNLPLPSAEGQEVVAPEPSVQEEPASEEPGGGDFARSPVSPPVAEENSPGGAIPDSAEEQPAGPAFVQPEAAIASPPTVTKLPSDPRRPMVNLARCGGCGHKLAYKDALSGKRVKCPACQQAFVLP